MMFSTKELFGAVVISALGGFLIGYKKATADVFFKTCDELLRRKAEKEAQKIKERP